MDRREERPISTESRQNESEFRSVGTRDFVLMGICSDLEFVLTEFCFGTEFTSHLELSI